MSAKLSASDDFDFVDRKRKMRRRITLELKMEVLRRIEAGERQADVSRSFGIPESSIRTIWKNADAVRIRSVFAPSLLAKQLTRFRSNLVERMEVMLSEWIDEQPDVGNIPLSVVMGRARSIFNYLKQEAGPRAAQEQFSASRGWYHRFKRRMSLRVMTGQEGRGGGQFGCRGDKEEADGGNSNGMAAIIIKVGEDVVKGENGGEGGPEYGGGVYPPPLECKIGGMDDTNGDQDNGNNDSNDTSDSEEDDIVLANLQSHNHNQSQIEVPQPLGIKVEHIQQQTLRTPNQSHTQTSQSTTQDQALLLDRNLSHDVLTEALGKIYEGLELFAKNDPDWYRSTEVKANVLNSVFCYSVMVQQQQDAKTGQKQRHVGDVASCE